MVAIKVAAAASALLWLGAQAVEAPIPGYGVEDFTWEIEALPGTITTVTGTLEDVVAAVDEVNPEFLLANATADALAQRDIDPEALGLIKREHNICNNFPAANWIEIEDAIRRLRRVGGQPSNGPGPGNCGRVSCSWGNAIWWCNDNTFTKVLSSFEHIANAAYVIITECPRTRYPEISGQRFHNDKWNVIVRNTPC